MNKFFTVVGLIIFLGCGQGLCSESSFPSTLNAGNTQLVKSGVGSLSRWFIKGCDIALYAEADTKKGQILEDIPKSLEFYYVRTIKAEQFAVAAWDTLKKNWDDKTLQAEKGAIDEMHAMMKAVDRGDRYRLLYVPGEGTSLSLNGKVMGRVDGAPFAKVYFSIWLGADPIDTTARDRMMEGLK